MEAHFAACRRAPELGFGRYIISATTPLTRHDLTTLRSDPAAVVAERVPDHVDVYARLGWAMPHEIERVYVNQAARRDLGWRPTYDFAHAIACLARGEDYRSPLAQAVGSKGYHAEIFEDGPYPVVEPGA